ncbi:MAG TPA: hypothetical protein VJ715_06705 [Pyrinomonadaceae bacterium]|nr:hypothetical protein [Pyrinomonadaceae bacterium]
MFKRQRLTQCFLFMSLTCGIALAQEQAPVKRQPASVPITVAASGERVRFTAVGAVERMRLEVFDSSGASVFDTGFKPGSMRDWRLRGTHGQALPDSTYLCVVTVRELSGRMTFKQGSVLIEGGQAALALEGNGQPEAVETEQSLSPRRPTEPPAMTVTTHDGKDGQVTSTTGDLTFRTGDVFSGKDKELMRLTEDGKLGIGTKKPQATLDVNGTVRASKGIAFPDGTVLTSATGRAQKMNAPKGQPEPLISGSGTTGRLTKWTDGPNGTLGDSVVTESSSNIGIGTGAPTSKLTVVGAIQIGATSGAGVNPTLINPNTLANFAQVRFYPASGTNVNTSFAVVPRGAGQTNNRAQFSILNTDSVADPSNVEFATFRARGTDFVFGSGKTGEGVNRPLMLAAGFLTDNVTNDKQLVLATNGRVGVGTDSPGAKLTVLQDSGSNNALEVETTGSGFAGRFFGNGSSAKGVSIEAGDGEIGLQVDKGRIVLSYATVADGGTIPSDVAVVEVTNNGMPGDVPAVALPASAENGTVIIVGTTDPDGVQISGADSGPHTFVGILAIRFTRIGGLWKREAGN